MTRAEEGRHVALGSRQSGSPRQPAHFLSEEPVHKNVLVQDWILIWLLLEATSQTGSIICFPDEKTHANELKANAPCILLMLYSALHLQNKTSLNFQQKGEAEILEFSGLTWYMKSICQL